MMKKQLPKEPKIINQGTVTQDAQGQGPWEASNWSHLIQFPGLGSAEVVCLGSRDPVSGQVPSATQPKPISVPTPSHMNLSLKLSLKPRTVIPPISKGPRHHQYDGWLLCIVTSLLNIECPPHANPAISESPASPTTTTTTTDTELQRRWTEFRRYVNLNGGEKNDIFLFTNLSVEGNSSFRYDWRQPSQ